MSAIRRAANIPDPDNNTLDNNSHNNICQDNNQQDINSQSPTAYVFVYLINYSNTYFFILLLLHF